MLTVGFIVTPGFPVMSLAALSVFEFANLSAQEPCYDVHVLSEHGGPVQTATGTSVVTAAWGDAGFDTLIIGGNTRITPTSAALLDFVGSATNQSRRIASICTGAFALGDAGILRDRRVTTHWLFREEFRARFPKVQLDADRLFVVDGPIWTAAGNSAGIDLALFMLEKDYGPNLARAVARILVVDNRRPGKRTQHSAMLDLQPTSDRIQDALAYAQDNLHAPLSVEALAGAAGLGPRQFSRAFRTETGNTPAKAVERLRIEAAQLMIEKGRHSIENIAVETGFGDQERMRRAFQRVLGYPPRAVRRMAKA